MESPPPPVPPKHRVSPHVVQIRVKPVSTTTGASTRAHIHGQSTGGQHTVRILLDRGEMREYSSGTDSGACSDLEGSGGSPPPLPQKQTRRAGSLTSSGAASDDEISCDSLNSELEEDKDGWRVKVAEEEGGREVAPEEPRGLKSGNVTVHESRGFKPGSTPPQDPPRGLKPGIVVLQKPQGFKTVNVVLEEPQGLKPGILEEQGFKPVSTVSYTTRGFKPARTPSEDPPRVFKPASMIIEEPQGFIPEKVLDEQGFKPVSDFLDEHEGSKPRTLQTFADQKKIFLNKLIEEEVEKPENVSPSVPLKAKKLPESKVAHVCDRVTRVSFVREECPPLPPKKRVAESKSTISIQTPESSCDAKSSSNIQGQSSTTEVPDRRPSPDTLNLTSNPGNTDRKYPEANLKEAPESFHQKSPPEIMSQSKASPESIASDLQCDRKTVVKECAYADREIETAETIDPDSFYDFHINEKNAVAQSISNVSEEGDFFAGCRAYQEGEAATIKSSKGTIRGVKNRVRAGVQTFLQMHATKSWQEREAGQLVVYSSTMGIVRATYQRCMRVRQILRTHLVRFDERDVFMSREVQTELKERMGHDSIQVPQVFIEGQYVGDAEAIERLNESGELRRILKPYKSMDACVTCEVCGGYRLLPCPVCNGSKRSVHRNHFTTELVSLKCMNCDEVGLVKCYAC